MAERRMFAKTIVLSDAFLDMPMTARCLYFTLGMLADDDGFVNSPKSIIRQCGASNDDMNILLAKKFVIGFESGVIVIKHWRINNYLRSDRYRETSYTDEKGELTVEENGSYRLGIPGGIPNKDSKEKVSIVKDNKHKYGEYEHVLLSFDEFDKLRETYGERTVYKYIKILDEGIEMKGYKYKSHYLAMKKWIERDKGKKEDDELPAYDTSNNPQLDTDRLDELMRRRNG